MATRSKYIVMTHPDDVNIKTSFQIEQEQQEVTNWYVYEATVGALAGNAYISQNLHGGTTDSFNMGTGNGSSCTSFSRLTGTFTYSDAVVEANALMSGPYVTDIDQLKLDNIPGYDTYCSTVISGGGGGGGGGGCHLPGTQISMADGTFKSVENLQPGDQLVAASMSGLGLGEDDWRGWTVDASSFAMTGAITIVKAVRESKFYGYRRFNNGLLNITTEHPILVKRGSEVKFVRASEVLIGDFMFVDKNATIRWEEITSHEIVAQPWGDSAEGKDLRGEPLITVYELDCERHDVYFADGVLVHNAELVDGDGGDDIKEFA